MSEQRILDPSLEEFQLVDSKGDSHKYLVVMHPGGEGMGLVSELMSVGIGPIIEALGPLQQLAGGADALEAIAKLDLSSVAAETRTVLATGQVPELLRKVLARTRRDGKPLSQDAVYDAAWRGNYAEGLVAAWRVIEINGFFGPLLTLASLSSASSATSDSTPSEDEPSASSEA